MPGRYTRTKMGNRPIDMHRKVMTLALGRALLTEEYVHHKDEDKRNNALANLEIKTPLEHGRLHNLKHPLTKLCAVCGREFTPHKTKRKRKQTCGEEACRLRLIGLRQPNKVPDDLAADIRRRRAAGEKLATLAAAFGLAETTISKIARHAATTA